MATYVLIHGAGSDSWYWHLVVPELRARGHDVIAPDLPSDDDAAGLSEYADVVTDAVGDRRDLVVAAQSLGGFTAPLVCDRLPVRLLILVAAMVPVPGEPPGEWWANTGHDRAIAELLERHGPMSAWGPEAIAQVFLHDVDPAVAHDNERFQGAPGEGMFAEPWPLAAWPAVPTRVLIPTGDRLFPRDFQRRVARERLGLEIDEMAGGHLPMLSRPRELAQRLVELAHDRERPHAAS